MSRKALVRSALLARLAAPDQHVVRVGAALPVRGPGLAVLVAVFAGVFLELVWKEAEMRGF